MEQSPCFVNFLEILIIKTKKINEKKIKWKMNFWIILLSSCTWNFRKIWNPCHWKTFRGSNWINNISVTVMTNGLYRKTVSRVSSPSQQVSREVSDRQWHKSELTVSISLSTRLDFIFYSPTVIVKLKYILKLLNNFQTKNLLV